MRPRLPGASLDPGEARKLLWQLVGSARAASITGAAAPCREDVASDGADANAGLAEVLAAALHAAGPAATSAVAARRLLAVALDGAAGAEEAEALVDLLEVGVCAWGSVDRSALGMCRRAGQGRAQDGETDLAGAAYRRHERARIEIARNLD